MAKEREIERWITVKGVRVPIFAGESVADAVKSLKERIGKRNSNQPMTQKGKEQTKKEYTNARNAAHNAKPDKQEKANARFEQAKQKYSESKQKTGIKSTSFGKKEDAIREKLINNRARILKASPEERKNIVRENRELQSKLDNNVNKDLDEKERQIARSRAEADERNGKSDYIVAKNSEGQELKIPRKTYEARLEQLKQYKQGLYDMANNPKSRYKLNPNDLRKADEQIKDIENKLKTGREQGARQSSGKQTDWIEEHNRRAAEIMAKENAQRIKTYNERVSNLKPKEGFKTKTSGFDIQGSSHETMVDGIKFTHFSDFKDKATYAAPTNTVKKENGRIISGDFVRIHGSGYISDDLKVRKAIANAYGFTNFGKNKKG